MSNDVWKTLKSLYQSTNPSRKALLLEQLTLSRLYAKDYMLKNT